MSSAAGSAIAPELLAPAPTGAGDRIRYYYFRYEGTTAACNAALARYHHQQQQQKKREDPSRERDAAAVTADRALFDLWDTFGEEDDKARVALSFTSIYPRAKESVPAGTVGEDCGCEAASVTAAAVVDVDAAVSFQSTSGVGQKRVRCEDDAKKAAGAGDTPTTTAPQTCPPPHSHPLFPYPPMRFDHLRAIHLIVAAYAHSNTAAAGGGSARFVGAAAVVFCPLSGGGGAAALRTAVMKDEGAGAKAPVAVAVDAPHPIQLGRHEGYLQFLWVHPSYRNRKACAGTSGVVGASRIGSSLLEMALAMGFDAAHLSGACRRLLRIGAGAGAGVGVGVGGIGASSVPNTNESVSSSISSPHQGSIGIGALLSRAAGGMATNDQNEGTGGAPLTAGPSAAAVAECFRFRLHTMVHRPLPAALLAGGGVATSMLRTRESLLRDLFASPQPIAGSAGAGGTTGAGAEVVTVPTVGTLANAVAQLYMSFGFSERRLVKGYYAAPANKCSDNAAAAPTPVKADASEMALDRRALEATLRQRQRFY